MARKQKKGRRVFIRERQMIAGRKTKALKVGGGGVQNTQSPPPNLKHTQRKDTRPEPDQSLPKTEEGSPVRARGGANSRNVGVGTSGVGVNIPCSLKGDGKILLRTTLPNRTGGTGRRGGDGSIVWGGLKEECWMRLGKP